MEKQHCQLQIPGQSGNSGLFYLWPFDSHAKFPLPEHLCSTLHQENVGYGALMPFPICNFFLGKLGQSVSAIQTFRNRWYDKGDKDVITISKLNKGAHLNSSVDYL